MDSDDKERTLERHLRGARRYEERRENLAKRKQRGRPPRQRPELDDEFDDDVELAGEARARRPRFDSDPRTSSTLIEARVAEVARTEVRVLLGPEERVARVAPKVMAGGGLVVGDDVALDVNGRVVARRERRTLLQRRDPANDKRVRTIAANVDVGLIVLAPRENGLSLGFLDRAVTALEEGGVEAVVVVTKVDLLEKRSPSIESLEPWRIAGHAVFAVSSRTGEGIEELRHALSGRVAVLVGHSGVGKSTLVNALDPTAGRTTGDVRESDGRGRHTTTAARLLPFLDGGALVDTPGVRQFVPEGLDAASVAARIPEFAPWLGLCRFRDCAHLGDAGCAIESAALDDTSLASALVRYRRFVEAGA